MVFIWIVIIIAVTVGVMMYNKKRMGEMQSSNRDFMARHPDAAKVYLTTRAFITSEAVKVHSVNGGVPELFAEMGKSGFLVLPGTCTVEVSYSYTRPGVLHKNVTTTTDVVKKELVTEARKNYLLGFNRDENVFTFEEYDPASK
jgi:hypothetical protein